MSSQPIPVYPHTRVFVLTGAGISAESGIRTFRDSNGLWEEHRVEDVASPAGWRRDPGLVWRFYSERRAQASATQPNPAHRALAALEAHLGDNLFLCTQNIDHLHEAGGSKRVIHMHGELFKSRCSDASCASKPFEDHGQYRTIEEVPACERCGAMIRPHIVWFGEMPLYMEAIPRAVRICDLFVTVGSSGVVYPAAGLVQEVRFQQARGRQVRSVYVGLESPDNAVGFDEMRLGKAGEALPALFELRGA